MASGQQQHWGQGQGAYDGYYDQTGASYYAEGQQQDGAAEGYYDEHGQWQYYEYAQAQAYDQSAAYPNAAYANQDHAWNDSRSAAPSGTSAPAPAQGRPGFPASGTPVFSQESPQSGKKKSSINPRQIPRHVRRPPNADGLATGPTERIIFNTSGEHPPSPLDEFQVIDDGNASPRYIRLTCYQVPASSDIVETTRLSIGAIITPLAMPGPGEEPVPVVDMGEGGPIRCGRCHAYLNAFCTFSEDGQSFTCNLCEMRTPVPHWYVCNVDGNGMRRDRDQRAELHLGSVEYVAPPSYITRPIQEPCYIFVLDVSYQAIMTGLLETTVRSVRSAIEVMKAYPRVRVGIISYSSAVHVYSMKKSGQELSMMVIAGVEDVFVPIPFDRILVHVNDAEQFALLDMLLSKLSDLHSSNQSTCTAFGAAIQVAVEALDDCGGKLLVIQSSLPRTGLGALDDRDNQTIYATDKEKELFLPQDSYYQVLATTCAERFIAVDLFVCANAYVDIATVGVLSNMTGGQVFYYPDFHAAKDGYSLESDILTTLTRESGFEGVMVVRTSAGLKVADHFGNFFRRHTSEIELPAIDCDKSFAVRLEHESALSDKSFVGIQAALLYTTFNGERRIRVHTVRAPCTTSLPTVFRHSDLYAVVNLSLRQAALQTIEQGVSSTRSSLRQAVIDVLHTYRKHCASASSSGQLILPESLKLLPLYTLGLMKSPILYDCVRADARVYALGAAQAMPMGQALSFCLPSVFALHSLANTDICVQPLTDNEVMQMPEFELASREFIDEFGIYLLDNGCVIYIFVGVQADPNQVLELFGVEDVQLFDPNELVVYPNDDPRSLATRTSNLIEKLKVGRPAYCPVRIVHDRSPYLPDFNACLIEGTTRPPAGSKILESAPELMSYVDFLCHVHRQIQDRII
ncbi:unnamed protein product (mitochondrion) [Plasmodiophora brassicae]|uniref:Uncharacterized protein n=1 Tax=Plasmodiophora brassicae TaxID=37360 RepID=A0A0G4J6V5_PLABS|nr:hypothetical protein PBRA_003002 [Plasmodiophora brassicae]SPQ95476.1 unnamed protein product [Plasmodiophora brassicae]